MPVLCFALFLTAVLFTLLTGRQLLWALLLGLVLFTLLGLYRGFSLKALAEMAWERGRRSLIVVQVFLVIGMITALWRSSGTIAFFLYHGLRFVTPRVFLLAAFLLSAVLSLALGTSMGVTGTAGIILMLLARSGGVDPAMTAGAVLSGAYFGDRCSPMSSCATLVAACTGTDLYQNVREMLRTAALPTLLSVLFYAVLSYYHPITSVDAAVLSVLTDHMVLHPLTLLPALSMLALPLMKIPVKRSMAISAAAAFALTVFLQGMPWIEAAKTAVLGYAPTQPELAAILSGGGILSMARSAGVVFVTGLYAGILEGTHQLETAHHWAERLADRVGLFPTAILVSLGIDMIFCNQAVTVLMGEQLLAPAYRRRGASSMELAMDIANSGVLIADLVPWSIALTVPLSMLEVGAEAIPYMVLVYLIPLCYLVTKPCFRAGQNRPNSSERN